MSVLVVEDDALVRNVIVDYLDEAGFAAIEAGTGAEALDLIARVRPEIDAVVTDLNMPGGVEGDQVAAAIHTPGDPIPVIIISGRPDLLLPEWRAAGWFLLPKPFKGSALIQILLCLMEVRSARDPSIYAPQSLTNH